MNIFIAYFIALADARLTASDDKVLDLRANIHKLRHFATCTAILNEFECTHCSTQQEVSSTSR